MARDDENARQPSEDSDAPTLARKIEEVVEARKKNPSKVNGHRLLFDLLREARCEEDQRAILEASAQLPALTLEDCAFKLAAARWNQDEPGAGDQVADALLDDLVYISGAGEAGAGRG